MRERKNSHKRDQLVKSLANKIDNLVQEEMMGRSCVRLSPQLQTYYEKLMAVAERHTATDSTAPRRRGDQNSLTDREYNDDEYEDNDYFEEPFRRKRYAINFDVSTNSTRLSTFNSSQPTLHNRRQIN